MVPTAESNVRFYCRRWPTVFARARGAWIYDESGHAYLDCFSAAGSLNYGHNPPPLTEALIDHLRADGLVNSLDTGTVGRRKLLSALVEDLLRPRGLDYRIQFTGPTGTTAVEAALRIARKATGRRRIIALSGGYHGMTVDAITASDIASPAGLPVMDPDGLVRVPHEADAASPAAAVAALRVALADREPPAAVILETVQGEGGARALSADYLRTVDALCRARGTVLIVDDIQAGCGRTGTFFSFEGTGIRPGAVCLSKSLSGVGLPLSVVLIDPALDVWAPGEYTGTFRGNELAFLTARVALKTWWRDDAFPRTVAARAAALRDGLSSLGHGVGAPTGRGLLVGLPCESAAHADAVARAAFAAGLIVETCGRNGEAVKLLPPLTVTESEVDQIIETLVRVVSKVHRTSSG